MTPTPAALAAAEEIKKHFEGERIVVNSWDELSVGFLDSIAEIIDRHTSKPATDDSVRYFTDGFSKWEWRDGTMFVIEPEEHSLFSTPEEIIACCNVIETDEFGRKLAPEPEGGEG